HLRPKREVLAGLEPQELTGQLAGHGKGQGDRTVRQLLTVDDRQLVELMALPSRLAPGHEEAHGRTALNSSNGSPHARHRCSALHAVVPKRAISSVSSEPHRGHATAADSVCGARPIDTGTGPLCRGPAPAPGAAMCSSANAA